MVEIHRDIRGEISWLRSIENIDERYQYRDLLRT